MFTKVVSHNNVPYEVEVRLAPEDFKPSYLDGGGQEYVAKVDLKNVAHALRRDITLRHVTADLESRCFNMRIAAPKHFDSILVYVPHKRFQTLTLSNEA